MEDERWRYVILGPPDNNKRRKSVIFGYSTRKGEYVAIPGHSTDAETIVLKDFEELYKEHPQAIGVVKEVMEREGEKAVFVEQSKGKEKDKKVVVTITITTE